MEDREYLAHIQNAIVEIKAHTAGMDRRLRGRHQDPASGREEPPDRGRRCHKLSNALKQANADIPWDGIYAARNVVVHVYFGVNQKIVWDILQEDLDPLLAKVTKLLEEEAAPRSEARAVGAARSFACGIRTCYRVFYRVWHFWRFLFSRKLRGLNNTPEADSRRVHTAILLSRRSRAVSLAAYGGRKSLPNW